MKFWMSSKTYLIYLSVLIKSLYPPFPHLDCPAPGDLGDEHADEGAPADPPAPVEDGPGVHPGARPVRVVEVLVHESLPGQRDPYRA